MTTIYEQLLQLIWIDWATTSTALIYVFLAARENVWCWFWGIVSCSLWAYASYQLYDLYLDALLQLFYVIMSIVGLYQWTRGGSGSQPKPITTLPWRKHLVYVAIGSVTAILFGYSFAVYTPAAATYWDAFTTVFSVIATLLLVQKRLENWVYWIFIDLVYTGLYASRGAYLFSGLMIVYTVIAVMAFFRWRREKQTTIQIKSK